jgi:hypothetical protein
MGRETCENNFDLLAKDKLMFLVTHTKEEQLEWIVANREPGEQSKLDELMSLQLGENIDQL